MFGNMKVGVKLGLGFGLVLVLLGTLLAVGILRLTDIKRDVNVVVNQLWPKTQLLQDGLVGVNEIALGGRELVIAENAEQVRRARPHARRAPSASARPGTRSGQMISAAARQGLFAEVLDQPPALHPGAEACIELVEQGRSRQEARAPARRLQHHRGAVPPARQCAGPTRLPGRAAQRTGDEAHETRRHGYPDH